ncbi:uncharacterized protein LOC106158044 [Lingula anatina]|uniref:Uncharacterized protein LOC106158044 n=1 Tax=Lingula anatina TaxID=7574 RepID=A0A1S3HW97_LINAN|nr:uncharacterized protein LOC106158044 [Lingula anatina]|eukprot:XP_013389334.1 uncharacterized protein LOC106158044 [Lingula anatina]
MALYSTSWTVKLGLGLVILASLTTVTLTTTCSTPLGISNGFIITTGPYVNGTTVMYGCMTGFRMSGTPSQLCNSSLEWEGLPPNCTQPSEPTETVTNIVPYWVFLVAACLILLCLIFIVIVSCLYCVFKRRSHGENQVRSSPLPTIVTPREEKVHFAGDLYSNDGVLYVKSYHSSGPESTQYMKGNTTLATEDGGWITVVTDDFLPKNGRLPCTCSAHWQKHYHFRRFTETKDISTMTDFKKNNTTLEADATSPRTSTDSGENKFRKIAEMVGTKATIAEALGRNTQLAVKYKQPAKKLENKWLPHSHNVRYENQSTK